MDRSLKIVYNAKVFHGEVYTSPGTVSLVTVEKA